jgi:hypothetical protein
MRSKPSTLSRVREREYEESNTFGKHLLNFVIHKYQTKMKTTYNQEQIKELSEGIEDLSSEILNIFGKKILKRFNKK